MARRLNKIKKEYRDKITSEINDLSETEIEKIVKIIHVLKAEFLHVNDAPSLERFRCAKGAWKDVDVDNIYKGLNALWKQWNPLKSV